MEKARHKIVSGIDQGDERKRTSAADKAALLTGESPVSAIGQSAG